MTPTHNDATPDRDGDEQGRASRRAFMRDASDLVSATAMASFAGAGALRAMPPDPDVGHAQAATGSLEAPEGDWDLRWTERILRATDRAVFDWPSLGEPGNAGILDIAMRYLDNCEAVYGKRGRDACVVINIRTGATAAGVNDAAWERHAIAASNNAKDPETDAIATRNPFWRRATHAANDYTPPLLEALHERGAIFLVCDFALGHLAERLATKAGRDAAAVHADLRANLIPGATAVPSGMFGLVKAQNCGCAYMRL